MGVSNRKGDTGEFFFLGECAEKGYWTARTTQDCPYDVVLDRKKGKLERVQCKYRAMDKRGYVTFKLQDKWRDEYRGYTSNNIDFIALYVPEEKRTALIPIQDIEGVAEPILRIKEAKLKRKDPAKTFAEYLDW